jgi:multidrug efflux pump subunit AcrB
MSIGAFSVNNRVFVNLVLLLFISLGILSYRSMPKEVFPVVPLDMVTVTTVYQGVSPEEIEKIITVPIENAIQGIEGIDEISSSSSEGLSLVQVKLEQGKVLTKVAQDVESSINRMDPLPEDAEDPVVMEVETRYPVITLSLYGRVSERVLREVADELEDMIIDIPGVGEIVMTGYREREIWVEVDARRLEAYAIPITDVVDALRRRNLNLPGGAVKGKRQEYLIRTVGEFKNIEEILNTTVRPTRGGSSITIKDIATVSETYEELLEYGRVNGFRTISLFVTKKADGDVIDIVNKIKKITTDFEKRITLDVHIALTQDSSIYIKNRLQTLYSSGSIGFCVVCIVLFIFLDWKIALITALGIPLSFLGAFAFMNFSGMTINMLSLFSLIVVLGMIVDDAIIVSENTYRYLGLGVAAKDAVIRGTDQVVMPVVAAVSTTMAAFLPMLLMEGNLGKFMRVIPIVVSFALMASLIEAFLTLPSHLADFSPKKIRHTKAGYHKFKRIFSQVLISILRWRYVFVLFTITFAGLLAFVARYHIPFVLFSSKDIPAFIVQLTTPEGSPLSFTEKVTKEVEDILLTFPKTEIKEINSLVGNHYDISTGKRDVATNLGQVYVELPEFNAKDRVNGYKVAQHARDALKDIVGVKYLKVMEVQGGPPKGKAVELQVRGKEVGVIEVIAAYIKKYLSTIKGVVDIQDDHNKGKKEMVFTLDEEKSALMHMDVQAVATTLRTFFEGAKTSEIHKEKDQIKVIVKFAPQYRNDIEILKRLKVSNRQGQLIPLTTVGEFNLKEGSAVIRRKDQKRAITVMANVDENVITSTEVNKMVEQRFSNISENYPGYSFYFAGEQKEQRQSLDSLFDAFIIAVVAIYIILGTLFRSFIQPLIVMMAVPFAFIGVVIGHLVMDIPFGILSIIGFVSLSGIVVNDSLVLVDFINKNRLAGLKRWKSIINAAETRFRPIVLTSLTTIGGISTLAFKTTGQAAFLAPMAISIFWGLIFSTVLTLIIVPCFFAIMDDIIGLFGRWSSFRLSV